MNNQNQSTEEIDILQFFSAIGNMFKKLFAGIKNIFVQLFYVFLNFLLLLKKYYLYFGIAMLIGLGLSFLGKGKQNSIYSAAVTLRSNFGSQIPLQEKIDLLNALIKKKEFDVLAKELQIDSSTASHFTHFDMQPIINDVFLIDDYENYLMSKDTVVYKYIEYKDYKKNIQNNNNLNNYWQIEVLADVPEVFSTLNKGIKGLLREDKSLHQKENDYIKMLGLTRTKTLRSLEEIDTLRVVLNKAMLRLSNNPSEGSGVVVNSEKLRGPEGPYNLFYERYRLTNQLDRLTQKIAKYSQALVYINAFPQYGTKQESIIDNKHVKYPIYAFILVLLGIFFLQFNHYLNAYQKKKESQSI